MLKQILDRTGLRGNVLAPEKFTFLKRLLIHNVVNVTMIESQKPFYKMKTILLIHKKICFWNFNVRYNHTCD